MSGTIQILNEDEYVNICIDESIPAIFEEWLGRINGNEFKTVLEKKLQLFKEKSLNYPNLCWISDIRELRGPGEDDQLWARHEFHTLLYPAGVRKLAFIVAPKTYLRLTDEQTAGFTDSTGIQICYFDGYSEAASWLKKALLK